MASLIVCPDCGKVFFDALLRKMDISDIQAAGVGGKTRLKAILGVLKDDPLFIERVTSIGIVRDPFPDLIQRKVPQK
jgi:hypothetical protein